MINMITTLNVGKVLNYEKGHNDCLDWYAEKDVSAIVGAQGAIGGEKKNLAPHYALLVSVGLA